MSLNLRKVNPAVLIMAVIDLAVVVHAVPQPPPSMKHLKLQVSHLSPSSLLLIEQPILSSLLVVSGSSFLPFKFPTINYLLVHEFPLFTPTLSVLIVE